jgi:FMN reductase
MNYKDAPLIVGLGGGLGSESHSLSALKVALIASEKAGARIDLINLQVVRLPLFEPDKALSGYPADVKDFIRRIAGADGYLWASPAYHGTVSGVVKNALDFVELLSDRTPPYLDGKPVGLISTAGGTMAGVTTIQALMHTAHALRAWVVPLSVPIPKAWQVIDKKGHIKDPSIEDRLRLLGEEVVRFLSRKK